MQQIKQIGFTLFELIIVMAIVAILAGVAIPIYMNYTRRAYYSEVVHATEPYKLAVTECYNKFTSLVNCNHGTNNIPNQISTPTGAVQSLTVANGIITVTPLVKNGIEANDRYILAPTSVVNGVLVWTASGNGVSKGYAK